MEIFNFVKEDAVEVLSIVLLVPERVIVQLLPLELFEFIPPVPAMLKLPATVKVRALLLLKV